MASRILTCVSCTLYFFCLITLTTIGLTSIIVGFVGLGLYIPTLINYNTYITNVCSVIDREYTICEQQNNICYSVMWSVEYLVLNQTSESYIFSTITETYNTAVKALKDFRTYKENNSYTCYYPKDYVSDVQWNEPSSPTPYLIMMIVGFTLTGLYFIAIGIITIHRCRGR